MILIEEQKQLYEACSKAKRDIPLLQAEIAAAEAKPSDLLEVAPPPLASFPKVLVFFESAGEPSPQLDS